MMSGEPMNAIVWTGFMIGLAGSFHCIGMCGPIVLALPGAHDNRVRLAISRLLYNLGRTLTYGFMGLIMGIIAGFQNLYVLTKRVRRLEKEKEEADERK